MHRRGSAPAGQGAAIGAVPSARTVPAAATGPSRAIADAWPCTTLRLRLGLSDRGAEQLGADRLVVDLCVRYVGDDRQGLALAGRLHDERAVADDPAEQRLVEGHVRDLRERHHRDLAPDEAVEEQEALVGGDEPLAAPVQPRPDQPAHGAPPQEEAEVVQQHRPALAGGHLDVDDEREDGGRDGCADLAGQRQPVVADRDDRALAGYEGAVEVAVEPRPPRHVSLEAVSRRTSRCSPHRW